MKTVRVSILLMSIVILLSGCSLKTDGSDYGSLITNDSDYKQYTSLKEEGLLDESGAYFDSRLIPNEESELPEDNSLINVTFASNSFIDIRYSLYEDFREEIKTSQCFIQPGDSLYAKISLKNTKSNLYQCDCIEIFEISDDGSRKLIKTINVSENEDSYQIQFDGEGKQYSIIPVGEYENRILVFESFYKDKSNNNQQLGGTWYVNGNSYTEGIAEISPLESYTVKYDYSEYADSYYYVKSDPVCFYDKESEHSVIFWEANPNDEGTEYSVEMHRFITVNISNTDYSLVNSLANKYFGRPRALISIAKNQAELEIEDKASVDLKMLKCGDKLTLRVDEHFKVTSDLLVISAPTPIEGGFEYSITIPTRNDIYDYRITISARNSDTTGTYSDSDVAISNGRLVLTYKDGTLIENGSELPGDNEEVIVKIIPDDGYYVTGSKVKDDVYSETMKYSNFEKDRESIILNHPIKKYITITLSTTDQFGKCIYLLSGKEISGTVSLKEGDKIKLEYTLTDNAYEIVRKDWFDDLLSGLFYKDSVTITITISSEMDGQTLSPDQYIELSKKEEAN